MSNSRKLRNIIRKEIKSEITQKSKENLLNILKEEIIRSDNATRPGDPKFLIGHVGEPAFQRAIFLGCTSELKYKSKTSFVKWIDLELPVILSDKPKRPCIDLIGKSDNKMVLCELKFMSKSKSVGPKYAVLELLVYYYIILRNFRKLDIRKVHHKISADQFAWEDFKSKTPLLVVAANEKYWDYWLGGKKPKIYKKEFFNWMEDLISKLDLKDNLFLFKTADEDFEKQKEHSSHKEKYKPKLKSKKSKEWIEIS